MPLWNSSKKEPETVTMDKASGSKQLCSDEVTRDIRRAYEFKEVLGTYVPLDYFTAGYDFHIWGQRFFPFFQHGSMPKRFNNIILPLYSGADEAFKRSPVIRTQTLSLHNTRGSYLD